MLNQLRRDTALRVMTALTLLGCVLFFVFAGDAVRQTQVYWAFQVPLDAALALGAWRVREISPQRFRRFWSILAFAGASFTVGDAAQTVLTFVSPDPPSMNGGMVQTVFFAIGMTSNVVACLIFPQGLSTVREKSIFWLDATTVIVGGGVTAWCFAVNPLGSAHTDRLNASLTAALVIVAAFSATKVALIKAPPMARIAAWPMVAAASVQGISTFLPGDFQGTDHAYVFAIRLAPSVLIAAGPWIQAIVLRSGHTTRATKRRPYSLLPYGMIGLTFVIFFAMLPEHASSQLWGAAIGVVVTSCLVAGRQLVAFHDNMQLISRLDVALDEVRGHEAQLRSQAATDGLTGLANRTRFATLLSDELSAAPAGVSVLLIDLDDFKTVNDTLGHAAGDALLVAVSERLRESVRSATVGSNLGGANAPHLAADNAASLAGANAPHLAADNAASLAGANAPHRVADNAASLAGANAPHRAADNLARSVAGNLARSVAGNLARSVAGNLARSFADNVARVGGGIFGRAVDNAVSLAGDSAAHLSADHAAHLSADHAAHLSGDNAAHLAAHNIAGFGGGIVARLGGDEFAILLPGAHAAAAGLIADDIQRRLTEPMEALGHVLVTRASIGVARSQAGDDPSVLLSNADIAMYEAKRRGKSMWVEYTDAMGARISAEALLSREMAQAVERDEFMLLYQPIVRLEDGVLTGVESLIRWNHPTRGLVTPSEFIPVAERTGQIVAIGRWALREACRQGAEWRRAFPDTDLRIGVNVAGRQLREPGFVAEVDAVLTETGLPPNCLNIEVTETAVFDDEESTEVLFDLRGHGVRLSLDDFGTAASSLGLLLTTPVTSLKLDRSFVESITTVGRQAAVANAVSQMAAALELASVAEGIETAEQRVVLQDLGYRYGQGYLFARPLPPAEIASSWLSDRTSLAA